MLLVYRFHTPAYLHIYRKRGREIERTVLRCLERRIWDQAAALLTRRGRVGWPRKQKRAAHMNFEKRRWRRHTHIPNSCLGWITRLQKVRFFFLPVFGIRGNLGA